MRILITGAGGFVGRHLVDSLREHWGPELEIIPSSRTEAVDPVLGRLLALDVVDQAAVEQAVTTFRPDCIVHLAALAAVRRADADPFAAWQVHLWGTLNLAHAILRRAPGCLLLSAGSGQIYGATARSLPVLDEGALLAPTNVYEASKAAADLALGALASQGLRCLRMRPFNHTGAGQSDDFVVPSFAQQIARIEAGQLPPVIRVGNLDAMRDFLDVRDVTDAYALAIRKARDLERGTILNIASGIPRRIGDILEMLLRQSAVEITVERDPERMRPSDTPRSVGDARRAMDLLGWQPKRVFAETLSWILEDCRSRLAR